MLGNLNPDYYRDLIPETTFDSQEPMPDEVIVGAIGVGYYPTQDKSGYYSGFHMGLFNFGVGKFILNGLILTPNLDKHPAADRIVLNFVKYAQENSLLDRQELPSDFQYIINELYP